MHKPLAENYLYIYKTTEDVTYSIGVNINYVKGTISLIETDQTGFNGQGKQFLFAKRGVEYMNGWLDILTAMASAVLDAKAKLEAYQKENPKGSSVSV